MNNKNKIMKKLVIACVLLAFTSCMKEGKPVVVKDSVSNYKVEKLFEVDGISVYRFLDGNKRVYFTNRTGDVYTWGIKNKNVYNTQTICE